MSGSEPNQRSTYEISTLINNGRGANLNKNGTLYPFLVTAGGTSEAALEVGVDVSTQSKHKSTPNTLEMSSSSLNYDKLGEMV
jgi:hypothetical protein